ncbi:MAG: NAD(P)-dependent oxidoreductase, partial [Orrella sp.]
MSNQTQIGFIGLGKMGWPMAKRLVEAGYSLQVLEADQGRCAEFVAQVGGVACTSAKTLAQATNVIITILPTSAIVQSVLEGPDGVLAGLQPNTVLVEMSSGVPSITRHLAQLVSQAGGHLVDAPVSGGVPRAKTGELSIMFGGSNDQLSTLTPILQCMGQAIEPTGDVGSAHAMKALNNLVSAGGF